MTWPRLTGFWIALSLVHSVGAEQVYRCTNLQGVTVFSQQPCGPDARLETIDNPVVNPSDSPSAVNQLNRYRESVRRIDRLIGKETDAAATTGRKSAGRDVCDQVGSLTLRNARISREVIKCHSEQDVRAIHGEPDEVESWSDRLDYDQRWTYRADFNNSITTYIYFRDGYVSKWRTRGRPD
jgi:hypothetical protein